MITHLTLEHVEVGAVSVSGADHMLYIAFASELQWPAEHVPERVSTSLANGLDFLLITADSGVIEYCQTDGRVRLFVYKS